MPNKTQKKNGSRSHGTFRTNGLVGLGYGWITRCVGRHWCRRATISGELGEVYCATTSDQIAVLGEGSVDFVIDNLSGEGFPVLLRILRRGGRYASSGAIAGPVVSLDLRDMYLKDITMFGTTAWDEPVFPNLIRYIEASEIRPLLVGNWPLSDIAIAQAELVRRTHVGNFVLILPPL